MHNDKKKLKLNFDRSSNVLICFGFVSWFALEWRDWWSAARGLGPLVCEHLFTWNTQKGERNPSSLLIPKYTGLWYLGAFLCCTEFGSLGASQRFKVMFYGALVWDPLLIVAQIICFQCLYYLTLGLFMEILVGTRVSRISLVYFFDYVTITASTVTGWCVIAAFLLSSLAGWESSSFCFFFH